MATARPSQQGQTRSVFTSLPAILAQLAVLVGAVAAAYHLTNPDPLPTGAIPLSVFNNYLIQQHARYRIQDGSRVVSFRCPNIKHNKLQIICRLAIEGMPSSEVTVSENSSVSVVLGDTSYTLVCLQIARPSKKEDRDEAVVSLHRTVTS